MQVETDFFHPSLSLAASICTVVLSLTVLPSLLRVLHKVSFEHPCFFHTGWFPLDSFMWESVCWHVEYMPQHFLLILVETGDWLVSSLICYLVIVFPTNAQALIFKASNHDSNILIDLQLYVSTEITFDLKIIFDCGVAYLWFPYIVEFTECCGYLYFSSHLFFSFKISIGQYGTSSQLSGEGKHWDWMRTWEEGRRLGLAVQGTKNNWGELECGRDGMREWSEM